MVQVVDAPFPIQSQHSFFHSSALYVKAIKQLLPCLKINSEPSEKVESLLLIHTAAVKSWGFLLQFTLYVHQEGRGFVKMFFR